MKKLRLTGHIVRRIIIALFCLLVASAMAYVMLRVYDPHQNNLAALSSVCMDIVCIIIIFIIMCSFAFGHYSGNRTTRMFALLLLGTIWALFTDFLNWAYDGTLEFGRLTFWYTVGSLCMGSILSCILSLYLNAYMEENHGFSKMRKSAYACAVVNLISFVITFVLALTGTAFEFVDGHYHTGVLYDIVTVLPILTLLYLAGFLIFNVKKVGIHDVLAVVGYIFFMISGALIEAERNIGTTYVAVTIADIFIFIMLQNEIIAKEKRNVQEWMRKSSTDELTGFLNRYAYERDIAAFEKAGLPADFVYVSVDVNSLKKVNDTNGHSAGDELLSGAAECLKKCFGPYGRLYRIGGDEFIGLICADDNLLATIKKNITELTESWNGDLVSSLALSIGYVPLRETDNLPIRQIAILADRKMYEAKSEYYRITGIERRKR